MCHLTCASMALTAARVTKMEFANLIPVRSKVIECIVNQHAMSSMTSMMGGREREEFLTKKRKDHLMQRTKPCSSAYIAQVSFVTLYQWDIRPSVRGGRGRKPMIQVKTREYN